MDSANSYLRALYLDYVNNFLSIGYFAECHSITEDQALELLVMGRKMQDDHVRSIA